MTHDEIRKLIQAEQDGRITPEDEARLQQALAGSPEMQAEYERDQSLRRLLRGDRDTLAAPEGLAERVSRAALTRGHAERRTGRVLSFSAFARSGIAAAAVLVLAVGAFWMGTLRTSAQTDTEERLDLRRRMHVLESEHPEHSERIRALYERCFEELDSISRERDVAERRVRGELEQAIDDLIEGR